MGKRKSELMGDHEKWAEMTHSSCLYQDKSVTILSEIPCRVSMSENLPEHRREVVHVNWLISGNALPKSLGERIPRQPRQHQKSGEL